MKSTPSPTTADLSSGAETLQGWDSQAFKQQLLSHVRAQGGAKGLGDPKQFFQQLVKDGLETLLEAEMEDHLGYPKHDPAGRGSGNSRNGSTPKTVRGDFGEARIQTPRDRDGSFDPQIVPKRESSLGDFTDKIVSLYARGMTTREIEEHLREMYGIDVSPQFISRATDQLQEQITEWQSRPLDRLYPVVYVDGLRISVRTDKGVVKKCVYVVLGVATNGRQEVLRLWVEETEGARFWLKVFTDLKARGLLDILILCGDGLTGLPNAVASAYPHADLQLCVVHHVRNVTKFVAYKDRKKFCADMREIYAAPTVEAAALALDALQDRWGARYPMSIQSWRTHWDSLTTFFKYPVELRRIVYTTNAIESLNAQLRKNIANRKVFPHDEAVIKLLFLNIRNFSNRWTKRQCWDTVMNQLSVIFGDRLRPEITDGL